MFAGVQMPGQKKPCGVLPNYRLELAAPLPFAHWARSSTGALYGLIDRGGPMNSNALGTVSLKTLGVYWMVHAVIELQRSLILPFIEIGLGQGNIQRIEAGISFAHVLIFGIVGIFLTFKTQRALKLFSFDDDQKQLEIPTDRQYYEALAFALVGVFIAVPAIASLISHAAWLWWLRYPAQAMFREAYLEKFWSGLINNIVELLIGLFLILGRKGIVRTWRRSRPLSENSD
jgi:hypothetical protein